MFLEQRFPEKISYGSSGGPSYRTTVVDGLSGIRKKNIDWQYPLHSYDAVYGVKTIEEMYELLALFHNAQGMAHSFRYKDWADYNSLVPSMQITPFDQLLAVSDGVTTSYQIVKRYTIGNFTKDRIINKPVHNTVLVSVGGTATTDFTISDMGVITLGTTPTAGVEIRCGYEFDVPVSFGTDKLSTSYEQYQSLSTTVPILEERL